MGKIILYHGSPDKDIVPTFGFGDDKHDYGLYSVHCLRGDHNAGIFRGIFG